MPVGQNDEMSEPIGDFVKSLYKLVLARDNIGDEEFVYWTTEIKNGRSYADVLNLFWMSKEHQDKIKHTRNVSDKYPPGHFYSPIVDAEEFVELDKSAAVAQVNLKIPDDKIVELLEKIAPLGAMMPFIEEKTESWRYHFENTSFGFGDAFVYWGMLGHFKPSRIVEIGSGYTSALALDAIEFFDISTLCTFVDPYPALLRKVACPIGAQHMVVSSKVQNLDASIVDELQENDLLFVDSSHVVKSRSDVHFEITQLLPRLKRGVLVHFHDIFYPFEYPQSWIVDQKCSWNEIYMLHAFLLYNEAFEIVYFNDYVSKTMQPRLIDAVGVETAARIAINAGGGLWLRRL